MIQSTVFIVPILDKNGTFEVVTFTFMSKKNVNSVKPVAHIFLYFPSEIYIGIEINTLILFSKHVIIIIIYIWLFIGTGRIWSRFPSMYIQIN